MTNEELQKQNAELLRSLVEIKNVLAGNPMVKVGNSTVHYAYMMAKGAINSANAKVKAESLALH